MSPDFSWSPSKDDRVDVVEMSRGPTTFEREFDTFCSSFSGGSAWRNLSRVFFDKDAMEDYLAIRRQRAGICYMHAGAILQHYLQCKRTGLKDHKMLDLSTYIRDRMSDEDVAKILVKGGGGSSVSFFSRITGIPIEDLCSISFGKKKSQNPVFFNNCTSWAWDTYVELREPGLVSDFLIESAFVDERNSVFDYEVEKAEFSSYARSKNRDVPVKHSMVLIGAHREKETGKVWFLLQNFWRDKYFRLVSAEYLASCKAKISFVADDEDVSLKGSHKTVDAMYVETDLEVEECEELEVEGDEM
jgi:hypothetical protein